MTNPGLFGYDQVFVEARSDAPEPLHLLPLHSADSSPGFASLQGRDAAQGCVETSSHPTSKKLTQIHKTVEHNDFVKAYAHRHSAEPTNVAHEALMSRLSGVVGGSGLDLPQNNVCARTDDNLFIPSTLSPRVEVRYCLYIHSLQYGNGKLRNYKRNQRRSNL